MPILRREGDLMNKQSIGTVFIAACIAVIAFCVGVGVGASLMPETVDAVIESHRGTDYVVLDHEGTHYVIELGVGE